MRRIVSSVLVVALASFLGGAAAQAEAPAASPPPSAADASAAGAPVAGAPASTDPAFPQAFVDRTLGEATAPVTMTVYSALTCSHCAQFHLNVLPDIKKNYVDTGKLRIVFKEFPFNLLGLHAAMATLCVAPESYFDLARTLYRTQSSWAMSSEGEAVVRQMSGFAGLSPAQYAACTGSKPLEDRLIGERTHAVKDLQINSTPTFLFSDSLERIVGAQDYGKFVTLIERQLAKARAAKAQP